MSEVLRGKGPHDPKNGMFSSHVESAAAASIAGQFSASTANVFPFVGARVVMPHSAGAKRYVTVRDLLSPLQACADVLFIMALGLVVWAAFSLSGRGAPATVFATECMCLAIAAVTLVLERASSRTGALGVTTRLMRFRQAIKQWTWGLAGFLFFAFTFHASGELSRAFVASLYITGLMTFGFWRALVAPIVAHIGQKFGHTTNDAVVLGDISHAGVNQFVEELGSGEGGVSLIPLHGTCAETDWAKEQLRVLSEASRALRDAKNGSLYLCSAGLPVVRLESLCRSLSLLPVGTYIVPDTAVAGLARCRAFTVGSRTAFELRRPPLSRTQLLAKRLIDVVLGATLLVVLSPLLIATAVAIRLDSKGPILFVQQRTGHGGKLFYIVKYRTMHVMEDGEVVPQARRDDPRVTRLGRFLRSSSIDELPQLFNVLRGEMSLVGPRPHAVAHDEQYTKAIANYELRQHVKPGITGWAQVNGLRGETANIELMHRRIEFDVWYALNASLLLDIEILARTIFEVCRPRNAY